MSDAGPIIVKRKKVMPAAHHGGSWKVAYADFVTAMMAFFMVMWIMGMDAETRSMVAGYFNDPLGFVKNPPKSRSPFVTPGSPAPKPGQGSKSGDGVTFNERSDEDELKQLKSAIEKAVKSGADKTLQMLLEHFDVQITEEGLRIELAESVGAVFFESGRATILPEAMRLIHELGPVLGSSKRKIEVEGHTDAQPYGGTGYTNWDLSSDRALALYHALCTGGVNESQIVGIKGFAATRLKNRTDPRHYSNRRVSILLPFKSKLGQIEGLPGDAFKSGVQAAFRKDILVAPNKPDIKDGYNAPALTRQKPSSKGSSTQ